MEETGNEQENEKKNEQERMDKGLQHKKYQHRKKRWTSI
jgi:hypothetical protein